MIREIPVSSVTSAVKSLCISSNKILPSGVKRSIEKACYEETNVLCQKVLCDLMENLQASKKLDIPICQDTGMAVVFLDIGQNVHFIGGCLYDAVNKGVCQGYTEGLMRFSIVSDPLRRVNTNDNTPAVIHTRIVEGDRVKISVSPKGFGSENMSAVKMFRPSASRDDIIEFISDTVKTAGSNPCPPIIIGVGIGGNFEYSAELAKRALLRELGEYNSDEFYAQMEKDSLLAVNSTGIGAQGFGGIITALAVNILTAPTHIAGLPVAVNISCHVTRHGETVI